MTNQRCLLLQTASLCRQAVPPLIQAVAIEINSAKNSDEKACASLAVSPS